MALPSPFERWLVARTPTFRRDEVQRFGDKCDLWRRIRGSGPSESRAQIQNVYGYWAQMPTRLPGEHAALGKLAERVSDELSVFDVRYRPPTITISPKI
jgi:hypothetical protein